MITEDSGQDSTSDLDSTAAPETGDEVPVVEQGPDLEQEQVAEPEPEPDTEQEFDQEQVQETELEGNGNDVMESDAGDQPEFGSDGGEGEDDGEDASDGSEETGVELESDGGGPAPLIQVEPADFTVAGGISAITLTWTAVADADHYVVLRRQEPCTGYLMMGTPLDTVFVDTDLRAGTRYRFKVAAVGTDGLEGPRTAYIEATANDGVAPSAAQNVTAYAGSGAVWLTWDAPLDADVWKYEIYRSYESGTFERVDNPLWLRDCAGHTTEFVTDLTTASVTAGTTMAWTDTEVLAAGAYQFVVYAVDFGGLRADPSTAVTVLISP